jgi:hypothetical protein
MRSIGESLTPRRAPALEMAPRALEMAPRALDGGAGERKQGPAGIGMRLERIAGEHMVRAATKVDV